jgi:hypothetical protein
MKALAVIVVLGSIACHRAEPVEKVGDRGGAALR